MRRSLWLFAALALTLPHGPAAAPTAAGPDAVIALQTTRDVERALLQEDTQRYDQLAARRDRTISRLSELYRSLDIAVKRTDEAGPESVSTIMDRIELAERERTAMLIQERVLTERIGERMRKIAIFEAEVAVLSDQSQRTIGRLSGNWRVTLLPISQRGQFALTQTGTLVSGTYTLEGGWSGSLQGTLVDRKVYLVRIDSKLGRSMELEGQLDPEGQRITGTWLNYELAGQDGATGQWSAVRAQPTP